MANYSYESLRGQGNIIFHINVGYNNCANCELHSYQSLFKTEQLTVHTMVVVFWQTLATVVTEFLKCSSFKLRCAESVNYKVNFEKLI